MPLPLSTMSTSRKFLLLHLFPSPPNRRRGGDCRQEAASSMTLCARLIQLLMFSFLLLLPLAESALEEVLGGGGVHLVAASQRRHHQERSTGSHVTARGCHYLRPGHLRSRRRPHPRRRSLLCPQAVVQLVDLLLTGPGGCRLAPWSAVRGVHLAGRVVQHRCQGHADGLLFVPEHRTQPPLSPALSSAHGLPA